MRNEKEMMDLIINFAKGNEHVRAVYMNGSRTNPNAPKDIFQDYDIVYVVTETASFISDKSWINQFGNLLMMQEPDRNDLGLQMDVDFQRSYSFLMLFKDGNRIDLRMLTKETMLNEYEKDSLTIPLLDKDSILPKIPPPSDRNYHLKKPTEEEFTSFTNEFWWCLQNVAKGIWRDELPYAQWMSERPIRNALNQVFSWWIGIKQNFNVSTGKSGKYFKKYLPEDYWQMYKKTYSEANDQSMWNSLFIACDLFRILAQDIAEHFSFYYPTEDDQNMTKYLKQIRILSIDATEIR
ncbi:aminoglycoside 6-adenylyltransferase [Pseudogracilibacillus sp. SE30717A]|uniref:aminoglycoside 6-adenylyltransferase n=1 Tax=Pseudogracilibacillus sp. SE30717A TaxID=3098293 RepID=UPI00300E1CEC